MPVTIDPSVEACNELVSRINSGTTYTLAVDATYREVMIDPLEEFNEQLRVDVVPGDEQQLHETLDLEDRTSHEIRVWVRSKVDSLDDGRIAALKLLTRQIWQRLNNWDSANRRVRVWECDPEKKEKPDKETLRNAGLFVASIVLRVEVEAS